MPWFRKPAVAAFSPRNRSSLNFSNSPEQRHDAAAGFRANCITGIVSSWPSSSYSCGEAARSYVHDDDHLKTRNREERGLNPSDRPTQHTEQMVAALLAASHSHNSFITAISKRSIGDMRDRAYIYFISFVCDRFCRWREKRRNFLRCCMELKSSSKFKTCQKWYLFIVSNVI